jgi:hypothetical protein
MKREGRYNYHICSANRRLELSNKSYWHYISVVLSPSGSCTYFLSNEYKLLKKCFCLFYIFGAMGPWLGCIFLCRSIHHASVCVCASGSLLSSEAAIAEIILHQHFTNIRGLKYASVAKCHFILGLLWLFVVTDKNWFWTGIQYY